MELGLGWQSDRINQDVTSTVWDSIQINNILFIVPSNENSLLIVGYSSRGQYPVLCFLSRV